MDADFIVVGAGLVGASLALSLAQQGFSVCVVEQKAQAPGADDHRPLSLSYASCHFLDDLGIGSLLSAHSQPIHTVHLAQAGAFGHLQWHAHELGLPALGSVVSFAKLQDLLGQALHDHPEITRSTATVTGMSQDKGGMHIEATALGQKRHWKTACVCAADGLHSNIRRMMPLESEALCQRGLAVAVQVSLAAQAPPIAFQRFCEQGTMAWLPTHEPQRARVVRTVLSACAPEGFQSGQERQCQLIIEDHFYGQIPAIKAVKIGGSFPLWTGMAAQNAGSGVVLFGHAAHALLPITAQGFNLSVSDIVAFTQTVTQARAEGHSIGAGHVLQNYASQRAPHQQRIATITDSLAAYFGIKGPLCPMLRGLTLAAAGMSRSFKKQLIQKILKV